MRTPAYYREKAARFRDMAKESDKQTAATLIELARDFEVEAERLERDAGPPMPTAS